MKVQFLPSPQTVKVIKMVKRTEIKIGDIRYVCGSSTKVKVIRGAGGIVPNCLILESGPQSKYTVGCKYNIPHRSLWANCSHPDGIRNGDKNGKRT